MSSKFFARSKGDRRNAAETQRKNGIVKIPAELKLYSTDCSKTSKDSNNNPMLPSFEHGTESLSDHSSRSEDSIKLHDAAVQSATSLLSVVNDMLRSPPISAHLSSQQHSGYFAPMHTRPRSHTAPEIALLDAPLIAPVELPGSSMVEELPGSSLEKDVQEYLVREITQRAPSSSFGNPIVSPQTNAHHYGHFHFEPNTFPSNTGNLFIARTSDSPLVAMNSPSLPASPGILRHDLSSVGFYQPATPPLPQMNRFEEDTLLDQISSLRVSHEVHVSSLKDAYEKEIAFQKSYITLLEKRQGHVQRQETLCICNQLLKTDTSGYESRTKESRSADGSDATETSVDSPTVQTITSQDTTSEAENLMLKLSEYRKSQLDSLDLRRQRDELRETNEDNDRRIRQLEVVIHKNKESKRALKIRVADLEARLVDSNNERLDVLEGFEEASTQLITLSKREKKLMEQLDELRSRLFYAHPTQKIIAQTSISTDQRSFAVAGHRQAVSAKPMATWDSDSTSKQIQDLESILVEKEAQINALEFRLSPDSDAVGSLSQSERILDLEKQLVSARSDVERFNSALHSEVRRQSRQAAHRSHTGTPEIESEALAHAAEKTSRLMTQIETMHSDGIATTSAEAVAILENELQHCIKEIIMYKLDVRGYKKEVKKTRAKMEEMQVRSGTLPPTPADMSSNASSGVQSGRSVMLGYRLGELPDIPNTGSGLAVSTMSYPLTPTMSSRGASKAGSPTSSPQMKTWTPISIHKELPRTPDSPLPGTLQ